MKEDRRLEVLPIAEPVGLLVDRLDLRVQPLRDGIGDPMMNEVQNLSAPSPLTSGFEWPNNIIERRVWKGGWNGSRNAVRA